MRPRRARERFSRLSAIAGVALAAMGASAFAGGLTTTWQAATGNWSDDANWSAGEPSTGDTADIPPQSAVTIDQDGETCLVLHVGTGAKGFGAQVNMTFGSLAVGESLHIGTSATFTTGTFSQIRGTVTTPMLLAEGGGYTAAGGTTTIDACLLDGGSLTVLDGAHVTVTSDVTIETGSALTVGGGTFIAGTDAAHDVVVRGEMALVNPTVEVSLQNLSLDGANSRLRVTIGGLAIDPITILGTFAQNGRFIVNDVSAPNGRYDVLTASTITGDFANVELPATGDWSWGIEGTTLFVVKGDISPIVEASWGRLRDHFTERPSSERATR